MSKRLGRPRSFDERSVLEKAQRVFLINGYDGASFEQIGKAMGLSKPSLYGAFGDKEALFERIASDYAAAAAEDVARHLSGRERLWSGAESFLSRAVDVYAAEEDRPLGCLLLGVALTVSAQRERIGAIVSTFLREVDSICERIVENEYARDAERLGASPRRLALQLGAALHTLALRARAGAARDELKSMAEDLSDAFLPETERSAARR